MLFSHPKQKHIYAVTTGKYLGELLVYIEKKKDNYSFLSLPEMKNRDISQVNFKTGITSKIVEPVEKIPSSVFSVCVEQYKKNIENNVYCA
jgi:hypothetical protein